MTRITSSESQSDNQPLPPNGKSILIAEDDPFISRMYETKLTSAGYTVTIKNNGRDAFEVIKANKPDLILLDLSMPELTGFEVLSALQSANFDLAASPVIILTNSSQEKDLEMAKKFGVDFYTKADLTPRELVDKINAKLGLATQAAPEA